MPTKNPAIAAAVASLKKTVGNCGFNLGLGLYPSKHCLLSGKSQQQLRVVPEALQMAAEAAVWKSL